MLDLIVAELGRQRSHIDHALSGLSEGELFTAHAPVTWTPAALLHHLAVDVERWWFGAIVAGDEVARHYFDANPDGAWTVPSGTDAIDLYRSERAASDRILDGARSDATPRWWPDFLGNPKDVAEIVLHVTTETATHAGHLDIIRESIDGTQWLVLDQ